MNMDLCMHTAISSYIYIYMKVFKSVCNNQINNNYNSCFFISVLKMDESIRFFLSNK